MEVITLNKTAPEWIYSSFEGKDTGGSIRLSDQIILLKIGDITKKDITSLEARVKIRVYRGASALLINLASKTLSFDLLWSPVIARANKEPLFQVAPDEHPIFNIITIDGKNKVRAIRTASVSNEVATAISRGTQELSVKPISEYDVNMEVAALFSLYDSGNCPDGMFHAICNLGD